MLSPDRLVKRSRSRLGSRDSAALAHTAGNYFLRIPAVILGNGCLALAGQRYRDAGADRNR